MVNRQEVTMLLREMESGIIWSWRT